MSEAPTLTTHQLQITRVFNAPRDLVWAAWTTPAQVEQWFAPRPVVIRPGSVVVDPRPGGEFSLIMVMPDGTEFPNNGTFSAFDPPSHLAFAGTVENHPGLTRASTDVTLADLGDGRTRLTVEHTLVCSEEMPELARRGWNQALDQLAEVASP